MSQGSSIDHIMNERRQKGVDLKAHGLNDYQNGFYPSSESEDFFRSQFGEQSEKTTNELIKPSRSQGA